MILETTRRGETDKGTMGQGRLGYCAMSSRYFCNSRRHQKFKRHKLISPTPEQTRLTQRPWQSSQAVRLDPTQDQLKAHSGRWDASARISISSLEWTLECDAGWNSCAHSNDAWITWYLIILQE